MTNQIKYNFSFTASSLRLNEMIMVAKHQINKIQLDVVNSLGGGKSTTGKRMIMEFEKRIATLTHDELKILVDGDLVSQKQLAFLSVCKAHLFIRDFVIEVLREKLLVFDYLITEGDYITFYRRKADLHPEMEKLTELTQDKVKQVTFKILEQAGIIDDIKNKVIQPQLLESKLINVIASDNKEWLKVFFMSDLDIKNIK